MSDMKVLMNEKDSTRILITQAQDGNRSAFESLVEGYRIRVESFVRVRLGDHLKPQADVEDILQETFLRAFNSIKRFRWQGEESFIRWLNGIAEHVILKLASRMQRQQKLYIDNIASVSGDESLSKAARRNERFDRLQKALDGLSPKYREVILLARIEGLKVQEIAERMNKTPNAVLLLISRALAKLKERFGETESLHLPPRRLDEQGSDNGDG